MSQRSGEADLVTGEGDDVEKLPEPRLWSISREQAAARSRVTEDSATDDTHAALPQGFVLEEGSIEQLLPRLARLERRVRIQTAALILVGVLAAAVVAVDRFLGLDVVVKQTLMESQEFTLLDGDGTGRLFIRMYSKVPVLQIMDSKGNPRMSMGLRFDDTPFIDLSDRSGRTRATFEMTEDDSPALRLFDENGERTFNIN